MGQRGCCRRQAARSKGDFALVPVLAAAACLMVMGWYKASCCWWGWLCLVSQAGSRVLQWGHEEPCSVRRQAIPDSLSALPGICLCLRSRGERARLMCWCPKRCPRAQINRKSGGAAFLPPDQLSASVPGSGATGTADGAWGEV